MRRRRIVMAMALGLALGVLGEALGLTPGWRFFEEGIGQHWLFRLRGPLPPPPEVAVVTLDRTSAAHLGLPEKLREWPRDIHARLIDRLSAAGASAIAFDLIFERPRGDAAEDLALGRAIRTADRVVLLELIREHDRRIDASDGTIGMLTTRQTVRPLPSLADGAVAVAPFPLPRLPMLVNHFWTFIPGGEGARPTMPAAMLHHHLRQRIEGWADMAGGVATAARLEPVSAGARSPPAEVEMAGLRARMLERPETIPALERAIAQPQRAAPLIDLLAGPSARWINFYGPPGHITTWPAHAVLGDETFEGFRDEIEGRAVFVGMGELHSAHEDAFRTIYSTGKVDLAGIEIAATIFANLLENRTLEPLSGWRLAALFVIAGLLIAAVATLLKAPLALAASALLALGYTWLAVLAFEAALWLPLAIPLLVQLPLGLFGGLFLQYRGARRAEQNLASGMSFYLPPALAGELAEEPAAVSRTDLVDGVCFVSDIVDFTSLADRRDPATVSRILNRYFDLAFAAIRAERGTVTDIVGDGVTAFWHGLDVDARRAACRAALRIQREVHRIDCDGEWVELPTRIGLNAGRVILGGVGGSGRFAYSVIGDVVNTASRLEKLNKLLGTRIVTSAATVSGLDGFVRRPLGEFLLRGKTERLAAAELLEVDEDTSVWIDTFARALASFRAGRLDEAGAGFRRILSTWDDGPSRFYLKLCEQDPGLPARRGPAGVVQLG